MSVLHVNMQAASNLILQNKKGRENDRHNTFVQNIFRSTLHNSVENNRNLQVEAKTPKLTYAEAVRASRAVRLQNELISDGQTHDGEALERCKAYAH